MRDCFCKTRKQKKSFLTAFNTELTKLLQVNNTNLSAEDDEETIVDLLLDIDDIEIRYNIADGKLIDIL